VFFPVASDDQIDRDAQQKREQRLSQFRRGEIRRKWINSVDQNYKARRASSNEKTRHKIHQATSKRANDRLREVNGARMKTKNRIEPGQEIWINRSAIERRLGGSARLQRKPLATHDVSRQRVVTNRVVRCELVKRDKNQPHAEGPKEKIKQGP